MRILMVHNRFGEHVRGGAERVVERLVDALRTRGHRVDVYSSTTVGFRALEQLPAIIRACWHLIDLLNLVAALRLRAVLRRTQPDIVHTHNLIGCGGLTPWIIRRSDLSWVHTLHDAQLITPSGLLVRDQPQSWIERSFLGSWFRALRRHLFRSPDVVTSPSRWLLQLHRGERFFPKSRDAVVGNPIDVQTNSRMDTRKRGQTLYAKGSDPFSAVRAFLFVGQVEGVKGIIVLVEAYRQLRAMFPDITLHVVGDGTVLPLLKRMTRDLRGLTLRGRLDAEGVRRAIAGSDVLVMPSLCAENQPSAILEAFTAGVPVIASRIGGIPELVQGGETGFLVDPGSVDDLLRALRLCVEDPERVRAMAPACHAVAEQHAAQRVAEQFEALYTHAAAERRGYGVNAAREPMGEAEAGEG